MMKVLSRKLNIKNKISLYFVKKTKKNNFILSHKTFGILLYFIRAIYKDFKVEWNYG